LLQNRSDFAERKLVEQSQREGEKAKLIAELQEEVNAYKVCLPIASNPVLLSSFSTSLIALQMEKRKTCEKIMTLRGYLAAAEVKTKRALEDRVRLLSSSSCTG